MRHACIAYARGTCVVEYRIPNNNTHRLLLVTDGHLLDCLLNFTLRLVDDWWSVVGNWQLVMGFGPNGVPGLT